MFPLAGSRGNCKGFRDVFDAYNETTLRVELSGPASFARIIYKAIELVREKGQVCSSGPYVASTSKHIFTNLDYASDIVSGYTSLNINLHSLITYGCEVYFMFCKYEYWYWYSFSY